MLFWLGLPELLLLAIAIALGVVTIPLAALQARTASWWAHALLSIAIVAWIAVTFYQAVLVDVVPWWRIAVVFTAGGVVSPIATGWVARWAVRQWPSRRWPMASFAALICIVLGGLASVGITHFMLPGIDVVNAVK